VPQALYASNRAHIVTITVTLTGRGQAWSSGTVKLLRNVPPGFRRSSCSLDRFVFRAHRAEHLVCGRFVPIFSANGFGPMSLMEAD
jgi:hypothetical protein